MFLQHHPLFQLAYKVVIFAPNFEGNDYYAASDSYIVTGAVGGSQDNPQITLSDGVTTSNITFDNPDDTMNVGGTDYNVISWDCCTYLTIQRCYF